MSPILPGRQMNTIGYDGQGVATPTSGGQYPNYPEQMRTQDFTGFAGQPGMNQRNRTERD